MCKNLGIECISKLEYDFIVLNNILVLYSLKK